MVHVDHFKDQSRWSSVVSVNSLAYFALPLVLLQILVIQLHVEAVGAVELPAVNVVALDRRVHDFCDNILINTLEERKGKLTLADATEKIFIYLVNSGANEAHDVVTLFQLGLAYKVVGDVLAILHHAPGPLFDKVGLE